jgi:hypothetical protein
METTNCTGLSFTITDLPPDKKPSTLRGEGKWQHLVKTVYALPPEKAMLLKTDDANLSALYIAARKLGLPISVKKESGNSFFVFARRSEQSSVAA